MKLPRHASITLSVDTSVTRREENWQQIFYILRRAMSGEPFAESEIEYYGIGFSAREATSGEFPPEK